MSHGKCVRTIESFFASNRSQTESSKNNTEDKRCINQEEMNEVQRKLKNLAVRSHIVVLQRGQSSAIFVGNQGPV